jgi:hypothetical protein
MCVVQVLKLIIMYRYVNTFSKEWALKTSKLPPGFLKINLFVYDHPKSWKFGEREFYSRKSCLHSVGSYCKEF